MTRTRPALFTAAVLLSASALMSAAAVAQQDDSAGREVYEQECATCHDGGDIRAHALETLQSMSAGAIEHALTEGVMSQQGELLSAREREAVIEYLAAEDTSDAWVADNMCAADQREINLEPVAMARPGVDRHFTRHLDAEQAGLSTEDMEDMELVWALGFPGVSGLRAAPVIAGDTVFYSAGQTQKLLALDAASGCVKWAYDSPTPLRSSVSLGSLGEDGPMVLVFADGRAQVHAVNAHTGESIWTVNGQAREGEGQITGSILLHEDKVFVPISASGVGAAINPRHECCEGRGAVTALDAASGEKLWRYFTMPPAEYTGEVNALEVPLRGPSGAAIWSSPSLDAEHGQLYVTTGQNTSLPATETSDAIIAIDADTGEEQWVFQGTANDVWNMACSTSGGDHGPNCPGPENSIMQDWDFGSSAVLAELEDGSQRLLAGQKSGHLWALNPDDGSLVWQQRVGDGSPLGGNHWGIAVDDERVYMPINDPHFPAIEDYTPMPGMYAFDLSDGEPAWQFRTSPDCSGDRAEYAETCDEKYGLSALPLVVDGAVITAGIDGRIYILDTEDGSVLFQHDSARPYETINRVEAEGGAIDAHSIAAGAGMVFIGSGYGSFRQPAGNVLLAFRPRQSGD